MVTLVEGGRDVASRALGGELTPAQRTLRARMAAYTLHSTRDSRETTRPALDAFMARFEREVDPDGILTRAERSRRAEAARRAYFTKLAYKSARCAKRSATSLSPDRSTDRDQSEPIAGAHTTMGCPGGSSAALAP
jgi:hypothetical protein